MSIHCVECGTTVSDHWWKVAESRWLCEQDAAKIRDVFALAAMLGVPALELLLAVCDD